MSEDRWPEDMNIEGAALGEPSKTPQQIAAEILALTNDTPPEVAEAMREKLDKIRMKPTGDILSKRVTW